MADRAGRGLVGFLASFVATIVFPIQWIRSYRLAGRHLDADPSGPMKVLAGIAVGVVLAAAGALALVAIHQSLTEGVYDTLDENLQVEVYEQEYQDQLSVVSQTDNQIPTIRRNLQDALDSVETSLVEMPAEQSAALQGEWNEQLELAAELVRAAEAGEPTRDARQAYGDDSEGGRQDRLVANFTAGIEGLGLDENETAARLAALDAALALPPTLADAHEDRQTAQDRAAALASHHAFYLELQPAIEAQDDDRVRREIIEFNQGLPETSEDRIAIEAVETRFQSKQNAVDGMQAFFLYWPVWGWFSLFGLLMGPLVIAQGSILRRAWAPSDTVGFRPYPSLSAGLFLLLGAFNVPAPFFAAWSFHDMEARSKEGQISL